MTSALPRGKGRKSFTIANLEMVNSTPRHTPVVRTVPQFLTLRHSPRMHRQHQLLHYLLCYKVVGCFAVN